MRNKAAKEMTACIGVRSITAVWDKNKNAKYSLQRSESQNHRKDQVEKDCRDHWVQLFIVKARPRQRLSNTLFI